MTKKRSRPLAKARMWAMKFDDEICAVSADKEVVDAEVEVWTHPAHTIKIIEVDVIEIRRKAK